MKRIVLGTRELKDASEQMRQEGIYHICGSSSLWVPSTQTKLIDAAVAREWPDLNGELVPMCPGEAARVEMSREWPDHKRVGWFKGQIRLLDWRPPLYCNPVGPGKFVQIDLTAAYWQIYRFLWLDTPFPGGYGNKPLFDVANRLENWKQARNSLVGVCRGRGAVAYKGQKRIDLKTQNIWLSPGLWATMQAILNEVATVAVRSGAVYVNTDGYIFPIHSSGWDLFERWLEANNFNWRVTTQGLGEIAGWCVYKVGDKQTILYKTGARPYGKLNSVRTDTDGYFTEYLEKCRRWHRAKLERVTGNVGLVGSTATRNDSAVDVAVRTDANRPRQASFPLD